MEITIRITEATEGGYMYDIYDGNAVDDELAGDTYDGGQCTTTIGNALGMANEAALKMIRENFSDNTFNNDICPGSLDENGEPMDADETAHKFDDEGVCSECGATNITE